MICKCTAIHFFENYSVCDGDFIFWSAVISKATKEWSIVLIFGHDSFFKQMFFVILYFKGNVSKFYQQTENINLIFSWSQSTVFKVAPRVDKTEVFEKGWNIASRSCFESCIMKKNCFFFSQRKETAFFSFIFTIKLSSITLSYLNAHSTLNFARTFLCF